MTSGKVLRETRERKGYDLTTVARRLRIRPDILRAIEANDYAAMPPRGYTRNMVNAYARLLGLNPTEIVNMYLDEAYAVQVQKARDNAPSSGFNMEREPRLSKSGSRSSRISQESRYGNQAGSRRYERGGFSEGAGRYGRNLYDDRTQFSRDDYGVTRERMQRPGVSDRDFLSHHSGYTANDFSYPENRTGGRTVHVGETPMQYSASRMPGFLQSRGLVFAIAAVAVVVILAIVFIAFGNRGQADTDEVSKIPISGLNDTTGTEEEEESTAKVEVAPTSARVVMTVNKGDECYIETYVDNVTTPYSLTGPAQETAEVTGVLTIATWTPEFVSVTVDGSPVTLTSNDELGGIYTYTVDFPAILEKWRSTHTSREAQRSAALATAGNNAANQSKSSESASSQTTDTQENESESNYEEEQSNNEGDSSNNEGDSSNNEGDSSNNGEQSENGDGQAQTREGEAQ